MTSPSVRPILIVDDEPALLTALGALLSTFHPVVITADSGEDALIKCEGADPCLIILDMNLLGIGGVETAERIRSRSSESSIVPVLFLSGDIQGQSEAQAFASRCGGRAEFLMKPVAPPLLFSTIKGMLELC